MKVFQALTVKVGQILAQAENFRKKFRSLPIPHLRVPLKHDNQLFSSHFGVHGLRKMEPIRSVSKAKVIGHSQKAIGEHEFLDDVVTIGLFPTKKTLGNSFFLQLFVELGPMLLQPFESCFFVPA
jgi:hypothetical protein